MRYVAFLLLWLGSLVLILSSHSFLFVLFTRCCAVAVVALHCILFCIFLGIVFDLTYISFRFLGSRKPQSCFSFHFFLFGYFESSSEFMVSYFHVQRSGKTKSLTVNLNLFYPWCDGVLYFICFQDFWRLRKVMGEVIIIVERFWKMKVSQLFGVVKHIWFCEWSCLLRLSVFRPSKTFWEAWVFVHLIGSR